MSRSGMARGPPAAGLAEMAMGYAVPGTGGVGRTLGGRPAELGHEVTPGSRAKDSPTALEWVREAGAGARAGTFAEAASAAEVVVVAVGGRVALAALEAASAPGARPGRHPLGTQRGDAAAAVARSLPASGARGVQPGGPQGH
ncbi:NAD(P)-binding domain-containing protein [Streptomyces guryensis]|uniref:NAD(P)-binding domain-containing protein n=1 Tax=Streptomyces guryensis TaxID=2886947 RepID=UPI0027DECCF4|nr:NAD(P)-binding domain-containing protein [Streptomyces guryensis]